VLHIASTVRARTQAAVMRVDASCMPAVAALLQLLQLCCSCHAGGC
jgi:hypothetical protein